LFTTALRLLRLRLSHRVTALVAPTFDYWKMSASFLIKSAALSDRTLCCSVTLLVAAEAPATKVPCMDGYPT
jgi:hypothetical protein